MKENPKVIIIMPAYNTGHVLETTYNDIPKAGISELILVDDGSSDNTVEVAKKLGITVVAHPKNRGYGGAQKTGYAEALKHGADIVVMVHSDHQYDPTLTPKFIEPIATGKADLVTGSRMLEGGALEGGMPLWKYIPNRFLTALENLTFGTQITDYHNGFRSYSREVLEAVPFERFSEKFDFDTDIILQAAMRKFRIAEVAHQTRYRDENSQMPFGKAVRYGLGIVFTIIRFKLHTWGLVRSDLFEGKKHD